MNKTLIVFLMLQLQILVSCKKENNNKNDINSTFFSQIEVDLQVDSEHYYYTNGLEDNSRYVFGYRCDEVLDKDANKFIFFLDWSTNFDQNTVPPQPLNRHYVTFHINGFNGSSVYPVSNFNLEFEKVNFGSRVGDPCLVSIKKSYFDWEGDPWKYEIDFKCSVNDNLNPNDHFDVTGKIKCLDQTGPFHR